MTYEEFMEKPKLTEIFNLNRQHDINFIKNKLLVFKPRPTDFSGWIYVYYRQADELALQAKKLSHILLYKIGRTKNLPNTRVTV